jgi:hypothetical protein
LLVLLSGGIRVFLSSFILFRFLVEERRSRAKITVLTDVTPCLLVDTFWKEHTAPIFKMVIFSFLFQYMYRASFIFSL